MWKQAMEASYFREGLPKFRCEKEKWYPDTEAMLTQ